MENDHIPIKVINAVCTIATVLFTETSCVNQIESELVPGKIPITFSTKISHSTTRLSESAFSKGDRVGLFAMLHSTSLDEKRYIDNMRLECGEDGTTFIPEKTVFYPEGDATLDFISYYPYQEEGIAKGKSGMTISVKSDQNTVENHSLSDFLVAASPDIKSSSQNVELSYQHKLVKLKITLNPQESESATKLLKANPYIVATGFKTKALYDLETNSFTNLEDDADIIPYGEWSIDKNGNLTGKEIIIIPQDINAETQSFTIDWNGKIYTCPVPTLDIAGSNQCEINITAKENANLTLSGISGEIEAWNTIENGVTQNEENITEIHLASLSFDQSDVYRVYHEGKAITEICKEYLKSDELTSRAIVAYPIDENDNADLSQGTVLLFLDTDSLMCGGKISWNTVKNDFTYNTGNQYSISKFYLNSAGEVLLEKPETPISVNIISHTIRDIRKGELQTYPVVKIGVQYWMKDNLRATCYRNGSPISLKTTLGDGAGYFKPNNQEIYFYNGEAILQGELAPEKWRIPQVEDWNLLKNYVNNNASLVKSGEWIELTEGAGVQPVISTSGLKIEAVGMWREGEYAQSKKMVGYWSIDEARKSIPEETLFFTGSNNDFVYASSIATGKSYYKGLSIRCIKE